LFSQQISGTLAEHGLKMLKERARHNTMRGKSVEKYHRRRSVLVATLRRHILFLLLSAWLGLLLPVKSTPQTGGGFTIYGDLKVDESKVTGLKPMSFQVTLQSQKLSVIGRQTVPKNGRFRFENLSSGTYYLVVMLENSEVANVRVTLNGIIGTDYRQDISLEWQPDHAEKTPKAGVIPAAAAYQRSKANQTLFTKAEEAIKKKNFDEAGTLLRQIVHSDAKDFEAWTELGTVQFIMKDNSEAEKAYVRALDEQPFFILALLNLGKLRLEQHKFDQAIEILTKAVTVQPPSAEANYFLGEAYLNIKKGSKAVDYMNEAIRIDPAGKAEIHLRIAEIYDAVGLKDLAAVEYEKFLEKRSDYPEKKKLQRYITQNKKP
jgi:Tfp pilus assembly protein PilF